MQEGQGQWEVQGLHQLYSKTVDDDGDGDGDGDDDDRLFDSVISELVAHCDVDAADAADFEEAVSCFQDC